MASTLRQVVFPQFSCLRVVERLLLLSESRSPTPGMVSRPDGAISNPMQSSNMTPTKPELNIVPATPIDPVPSHSRP